MSYLKDPPELNYLTVVKVLLSRWYWLFATTSMSIIACYVYLQLSTQIYCSTATLKFEEKKSEIAELISVKNFYDRTNKVESERIVLSSKRVISTAIAALSKDITFLQPQTFGLRDIYPNTPLNIRIMKKNIGFIPEHTFVFSRVSKSLFHLTLTGTDKGFHGRFKYGQPISWQGNIFRIEKEPRENNGKIFFMLADRNELIEKISNTLKIGDSQDANMLTIKYTDTNPRFCRDFLNALLKSYLNFDKEQREASLNQTSDFITKMLIDINAKATKSAGDIQEYNLKNDIYDPKSQQEQTLTKLEILKGQRTELEFQKKLLQFNIKKVDIEGTTNRLTFDLRNIPDPQLLNLISKYQLLILSRNEKLNTYTPQSEVISIQNSQIQSLAIAIRTSLSEYIKTNERNLTLLSLMIDSISKQLKTFPEKENTSVSLLSRYEVYQKIFRYLSEKKLEALIAKAAVVPSAIILDGASYPPELISPVPGRSYLFFVTIGILSGLALILIINVHNPFLYTWQDIERVTSIPVLGIVRKNKHSKDNANHLAIQHASRSLFAESIRFLRGSLKLHAEKQSKVICITSETSGEGKSFLAVNLAYSFTLTQKKVALVSADLRKLSTHIFGFSNNGYGLSNYLSGETNLASICQPSSIEKLDIIPSGPIPANPSELIENDRMKTVIAHLKIQYDIIIIDSAPVGLVTDVKPLLKLSDINLFVLRCGVSRSHYALTAEKLRKDLDLSAMAIVLNDFEPDNFRIRYHNYRKPNIAYPNSYYYTNPYSQSKSSVL